MISVSVCMGFYDEIPQHRYPLLLRTLDTLTLGKKDEVVIVDDASTIPLKLDKKYKFKVNIIRIEPEQKWWRNPCIAYQTAVEAAKGDLLIIQNPECLWVGDIAKAAKKMPTGEYWSFAAYSLDKYTEPEEDIPTIDKPAGDGEQRGWFNHSVHRRAGYHWCVSVHKKYFVNKTLWFDERLAYGYGWEDNALLEQVKQHMVPKIVDKPYVVHQYHPRYSTDQLVKYYARNSRMWDTISTETTPDGPLYASHLPVLEQIFEFYKPEFVLELGCGKYSSPLLSQANTYLAFESNPTWRKEISQLIKHEIQDYTLDGPETFNLLRGDQFTSITKWYRDLANRISPPANSLLFIDQVGSERNISAIELANKFSIVILHDTEPQNELTAGWSILKNPHPYTYTFRCNGPWTTVWSKLPLQLKGVI